MFNNEDFIVDDILKPKMKKINTGQKGKRTERQIVKILSERFQEPFSRTIGSGNRFSQVPNMPQHAQEVFTGDLVTPENFGFVVESKGGYENIDLNAILEDGNSQLDEFIKQVSFDSGRCGRKPMVVWKKDRKPWLAILLTKNLPHLDWQYRIIYREWSIITLKELLSLPKEFFFDRS
jgi:Holliday junction resolvase